MKKILALFVIFVLIFNVLWVNNIVFATFDITNLSINTSTAAYFTFNPWDNFNINYTTTNWAWEDIKEVFGKIDFGNNAWFTYNWVNLKSVIWSTNTTSPIPASVYNSTTGFSHSITNPTYPTITNSATFWIKKITNSFVGFSINSNISTYQNNLSAWFDAKKTSDNSAISWTPISKVIYVNVRPHITDYYFEKSDWSQVTNQIQWSNSESINLVLKVKDYNSCTNIDWWVIIANLSSLWLWINENLSYVSCDVDGKTATFKKNWITTLASLGTYNFNNDNFTATDENNNTDTPNDPNTSFWSEDKTTNYSLTVISAWTPQVSILNLSDDYIWGTSNNNSNITFSGSQDWEIKISANSDWSCAWWVTILDWTWSGSYVANTSTWLTIQSTSLSDWINNVYACVKNTSWEIWSAVSIITKDTANPTISNITANPGSVVTNDPVVSFKCDENWTYLVTIGWFSSTNTTTAWITNNVTVTNIGNLIDWVNTINIKCIDRATNDWVWTVNITKSTAPPSLSWAISNFNDNDVDFDWLNWYDISLNWDNTLATWYTYFESYRLYLLPSNITFNSSVQTYIKIITDKNTSSWTWDILITKDSTNTDLVSASSYKICMAIMWTNWQLWEAWCSNSATLISDIVQHPVVLSAKFSSWWILELTTNSDLNSNLNSFSWWLVQFDSQGNTYTWTSVISVDWKKVNIWFPVINSLSITGSNLIIQTWAIRSLSGGYNDYFNSWSFLITDWQKPTISSLTNNTIALTWSFYSWSINFSYTLWENLAWWWDSYIQFARIWWNPSTNINYTISNTTLLSSGSHNFDLNLASIWLVEWTYYNIQFIWKDLAWNSNNSNTINSLKFDNVWPAIMTITPVGTVWLTNPILGWIWTTDNNWYWVWVAWYNLKIYTWSSCSGSFSTTWITDPLVLQYQILLADMNNYSRNITPYDHLGNYGITSNCDSFVINTNIPSFSSTTIKDTVLNSTSYAKINNKIEIQSTILNTDINNIWLDASVLKDNTYINLSCANPWISWVTCTYNSNIAKFTFDWWFTWALTSGVKQVQFKVANTSWINTGTTLASITLDNTNPIISGNPIISPTTGTYFGWTGANITWATSDITDNIWIAYLWFDYSINGWGNWTNIWTGSNAVPYNWNITSLDSWSNYKIKVIAYDLVWNSAEVISNTFSIDKITPTISWATLTTPTWWELLAWWGTKNILWNTGSEYISDNIALASNPIKLEYSEDNWVNWIIIGNNIPNNWNYNWTVPSINSSTVKIRISATDNAGNTSSGITSAFIIDSIKPAINVSFAWGGWTTPQNGKYINNSWIDLSANSTDIYLDKVYFSLINTTDWQYWNTSAESWIWVENWNLICTDWQASWTDLACSNIWQLINLNSIANSKDYRLTVRAIDEAWNSKDYNPIDYIWDNNWPILTINNSNNSFFSWSLNISWTSSDPLSWVNSTVVEIKKWANWWNWTTFVWTEQKLATSWTSTNWNYTFDPVGDNDGANYSVIVTTYDNAFKTNNYSTGGFSVTKDNSGPVVDNNIFTFNVWSWTLKWWINFPITWDKNLITSTWAPINNDSLNIDFFNWTNWINIATNINNSWSFDYLLPLVDTDNARFRLNIRDSIWNTSNTVLSNIFAIDSLPPSITWVQTMDNWAVWKIDWLLVKFSENVTNITQAKFQINLWWQGININSWQYGWDNTEIRLNFTSTWTSASLPDLIILTWALEDSVGNFNNYLTSVSSDNASPRIQKVEIFDNNSNWKQDQIKLTLSENLAISNDTTSFVINNPITWLSINSTSVSNNEITLNLQESSNFDTSNWWMTLTFNNDWSWKDTSNNVAGNFTNNNILDKALPILITSIIQDLSSNYKADFVKLTFSETLTGTLSWFSFTNLSTGSNYTWTVSLSWNIINLPISETTDDNDTGNKPNLSYNWDLNDSNWNNLASINNLQINDWISPKILSRETIDSNWNGKIDKIKLTFSENLNWLTWQFNASVDSYVVNNYTQNSNILEINIQESSIPDTSITPSVQILSNTSLTDNSSNLILTDNNPVNSTDKVGPIIIWARYSWNKIYAYLSENFSWTINTSYLLLSWSVLPNITSATWSNNQIILDLDTNATSWLSISLSWGTIWDIFGNIQSWNYYVNISSSVVINEVMYWSWNEKYIELRNLGSSPINLDSWSLQNAWITIPAWQQISANWYYLIGNSWISILSWVSADYSTNINITGDILLKDDLWNTFDSAKTSPMAAWSWSIGVAMERITNPWNWLSIADWYSSTASSWFINTTYKWTPWVTNVFDSTDPIISNSIPENNTLYPTWNINFEYDYSDNIEINTNNYNFEIQKWDWVSRNIITPNFSNSWITTAKANFNLNSLAYGAYKATFDIGDTNGNSAQKITTFYIDKLEITVSASNINLWLLDENNTVNATQDVVVMVKTLWTGFNVNLWWNWILETWINSIIKWNWSTWFWFSCTAWWLWVCNNNFSQINNTNIATNSTWTIDPDWNQQTFIYNIKYWAKINSSQVAWVYSWNTNYLFNLNY